MCQTRRLHPGGPQALVTPQEAARVTEKGAPGGCCANPRTTPGLPVPHVHDGASGSKLQPQESNTSVICGVSSYQSTPAISRFCYLEKRISKKAHSSPQPSAGSTGPVGTKGFPSRSQGHILVHINGGSKATGTGRMLCLDSPLTCLQVLQKDPAIH